MQAAVLLQTRALSIHFGATVALDGIDLDIRAGEVHAVVGENGAGKSTLMRVIAGAIRPASGSVDRYTQAIEWVPQETVLPPDLTVAEWVFLGREQRGRLGWLLPRAMRAAAAESLRTIGCDVTPMARAGSLPLAQRKQVQLARAICGAPDLLLLDEPTAVLGEQETRRLFAVVRGLRQRGAGVLYVSHRLDEVLAIADRVTVLRDGKHVSTDVVATVDTATLVRRMVGREIPMHLRADRALGAPVLRLVDIATAHVRELTLTLRAGEIVGLAGLVGAGRSEVLEAVAGIRRLRSGTRECTVSAAFVPEDRTSKGLIPTLRMRENVFLPADDWMLHPHRERQEMQQWIARLGIRASGPDADLGSLSGGNQQKALLARALRHHPRLLLLDEPTAGVDVGAKAEIHALISELAGGGTAILLASSDLPELLVLCDRIVAMRNGRCVGEVGGADATEPSVAALITGAAA